MLDYETLRLLWWALLGVLLIGFAVMDGFDLGVGTLSPHVARTDSERRIVINTIGPVWEGNQVWFILGGGAIFAAWPILYATAFSGFYLAMFIVLAALILRPVSITFRSKVSDPRWRRAWDTGFFVSGAVPALIFGVAFGNVIRGVPFRFDSSLVMTYEGSLLGLLNPFALLCGLLSVAMLALHGATYLGLKASGAIVERAVRAGRVAAFVAIVLFALAGVWVAFGIDGHVITSALPHDGPSNPLLKTAAMQGGAWLNNYKAFPLTIGAPIAGFAGLALAALLIGTRLPMLAFLASGLGVAGIIATAGLALFPFMLPSSLEPRAGLTVWDSSSSHLTLGIMLWVTLIFMPLILAYTAWVYRVLRGPITAAFVERNDHAAY